MKKKNLLSALLIVLLICGVLRIYHNRPKPWYENLKKGLTQIKQELDSLDSIGVVLQNQLDSLDSVSWKQVKPPDSIKIWSYKTLN